MSFVLLGTQNGQGIYRALWNSDAGSLGAPELAIATPRPTYLALHPHLPVVYACNEQDGDAAAVSAFGLNRTTATLTALGTQPTHGNSPCFVSVDPTGKLLFTANYGSGSLSAFPLDAGGRPGPALHVFQCAGSGLCGTPGPVPGRQDGPHIHCATLSPDGHYVLACDLGDDGILCFPLQPDSAQPVGTPLRLRARAGSGPRHIAFLPPHSSGGERFACIHELDCTVDLYSWPPHEGAGPLPGTAVALTPNANATSAHPNTAAELAVTRDGRFLYTSTRGANELTVLALAAGTNKLVPTQQIPCGGQTPRFFALDPTERWLLSAHQDSDSVTIFARDPATGRLSPHGETAAPSPMCIRWV